MAPNSLKPNVYKLSGTTPAERLSVISNHDHFLHIKPGDRRYTVLESSPAWKGTTKFEQLLDQWENGGAARFVYEALNHSFRQFDDRKRLVINTNLKTTAAVRQMAQSRSSLDKCIVSLLLRGDFRSIKTGETLLIRADGELAETAGIWKLDEELNIQSQALEQAVTLWLRDFDPTAAKHETTLHTIIGTLENYVGDTTPRRPKEKKNPGTGTRLQLPTARTLPVGAEAIKYAWENGLITNEEYKGAMPREADKVEGEAA